MRATRPGLEGLSEVSLTAPLDVGRIGSEGEEAGEAGIVLSLFLAESDAISPVIALDELGGGRVCRVLLEVPADFRILFVGLVAPARLGGVLLSVVVEMVGLCRRSGLEGVVFRLVGLPDCVGAMDTFLVELGPVGLRFSTSGAAVKLLSSSIELVDGFGL